MDFIFADDARQPKPSRPGMGALVALGGIHVPGGVAKELEKALAKLCDDYGFPPKEEFKWSPGKELWMRENLIELRREEFLIDVLTMAEDSGAGANVIIEDTGARTAVEDASSAEEDVTILFLERVDKRLRKVQSDGVIVVSRPTGPRKEETKFLASCLETLQAGTRFVEFERIALNVLTSPSKFIRLLQVADVVTSCTIAMVGGEDRYAPPVFESVKRMLQKDWDRIGGVGLKIHPDFKYCNLYHWLLGDSHVIKGNIGYPLPLDSRPYSSSPDSP